MKHLVLAVCMITLCGCADSSDEAYMQARAVGFDYENHYDDACDGDLQAITAFIDFTEHTDAAGALMHATHMFKVLQEAGDEIFATGMKNASSTWRDLAGQMLVLEGYWEFKKYKQGTDLKGSDLEEAFRREYPNTASAFDLTLPRP